MEQRDSRYDLIRSIAIILIVFIHSMGMLEGKAPAGWSPIRVEYALLKCLISPGVHLFLLLSGALLLGKTEPIGRFYRKRLRRILIPFILWSAVVYLLTGLTTRGFDWKHCVPDFGWRLLTNGIHGTYWFIYVILGLYLVTPLFRRICRTGAGCSALLALSAAVYGAMLVFPEVPRFSYVSCLMDYILGYWIVRYLPRSRPVIIAASVILGLSLLGDFLQRAITERAFPFEILTAASFFLIIVHSARAPRLSPAFLLLGECSLGIYLSHCIFVSTFTKTAEWMSVPPAAGPFFVALAVLAAEWILMWLLRLLHLDRMLA